MIFNRVKCATCKHLIEKEDAQKVPVEGAMSNWNLYYCPEHKRPYNRIVSSFYGEATRFKEFEVNEDGTPYGYVKEETTGMALTSDNIVSVLEGIRGGVGEPLPSGMPFRATKTRRKMSTEKAGEVLTHAIHRGRKPGSKNRVPCPTCNKKFKSLSMHYRFSEACRPT